jgi:hypothetical protein
MKDLIGLSSRISETIREKSLRKSKVVIRLFARLRQRESDEIVESRGNEEGERE